MPGQAFLLIRLAAEFSLPRVNVFLGERTYEAGGYGGWEARCSPPLGVICASPGFITDMQRRAERNSHRVFQSPSYVCYIMFDSMTKSATNVNKYPF